MNDHCQLVRNITPIVRMKRISVIIAAVAALVCGQSAFAEFPIMHYPDNAVPSIGHRNCIFQDARGFMWFGGDAGAVLYDGREFRRFTVADGLADNYVHNIVQAPDGNVWLCTWRGISAFDPEVGMMSILTDWGSQSIRNVVFVDSVAFAATDGAVKMRRGLGFYTFRWVDVLIRQRSTNLAVDIAYDSTNHRLAIATELEGVILVSPDSLLNIWELRDKALQREYESTPPDLFQERHPDLHLSAYDFKSFTEDTALAVAVRERERAIMAYNPVSAEGFRLEDWFLSSVKVTRDGDIWVYSKPFGMFKLEGGSFASVNPFDCHPGRINGFSVDGNGDILAATDQGLCVSTDRDTVCIGAETGLVDADVEYGYRDSQGIVWIATASGQLVKSSMAGVTIFDESDYPTLRGANNLLRLSTGDVLISGTGGFSLLSEGGISKWMYQPPESESVLQLALDRRNQVVFVTDRAVYAVIGSSVRKVSRLLDPGYDAVSMAMGLDGKLWISAGWFTGYWDGGQLVELRGVSGVTYFSNIIAPGADGTMFFGNWNFPYILDGHRLIRISDLGIHTNETDSPSVNWQEKRPASDQNWIADLVVTCAEWGNDSAYWTGSFSGEIARITSTEARRFDLGRRFGRFVSTCRNESGELELFGSQGMAVIRNGKPEWDQKGNLPGSPEMRDVYITPEGRRFFATADGLFILGSAGTICLNSGLGLKHDGVLRVIATGPGEVLALQPGSVVLIDWQALTQDSEVTRKIALIGTSPRQLVGQ